MGFCGRCAEVFARAKPGFDAISITTHGASAALLSADGKLAMPVLDYEHEYPQEIQDAYTALRPSFEETYSPRQSMGLNVGAQLHYQKTAFTEEFAEGGNDRHLSAILGVHG